MEKVNIERLLKLLRMTASQHDGEALSAMRAANRLLASAGMDWEALLTGRVIEIPPRPRKPQDDWEHVGNMFLELSKVILPTDVLGFVMGVLDTFNRTGTISDSQYDGLKRTHYRNCVANKKKEA